jgi:hypothetical protein
MTTRTKRLAAVGVVLLAILGISVGGLYYLQWRSIQHIGRDIAAGIHRQVVDDIQRQVASATAALKAPLNELDLFIAKNHRPPTDIEELAAFANDDPGFDRSKFSELRLEFPSDEAVAIAWRLAPPLHGAGTNTLLNWRRDLDEPPNY